MPGVKLQSIAGVMLLTLLLLVSARLQSAERIQVKGLFKDRAILVIGGKQHLLRAGQSSPEGVKLISANSHEALVEIHGQRSILTLGNSISSNFSAPRRQRLRIVADAHGMYMTTGSINGFPVKFIIDTGATLLSMSRQQAKRLGIDYRLEGQPAVSTTASGIIRIYRIKLQRVKIGDIELKGVDAAVHEGDFPPVTLLGMSFLSRIELHRQGTALELQRRY